MADNFIIVSAQPPPVGHNSVLSKIKPINIFRFRIDNTDHIIDVHYQHHQYTQINIICPFYPRNVQVHCAALGVTFRLRDTA